MQTSSLSLAVCIIEQKKDIRKLFSGITPLVLILSEITDLLANDYIMVNESGKIKTANNLTNNHSYLTTTYTYIQQHDPYSFSRIAEKIIISKDLKPILIGIVNKLIEDDLINPVIVETTIGIKTNYQCTPNLANNIIQESFRKLKNASYTVHDLILFTLLLELKLLHHYLNEESTVFVKKMLIFNKNQPLLNLVYKVISRYDITMLAAASSATIYK